MKSNRLSILLAAVLALVTGALVLAYTLGADNRALQGATSVEVYVASATFPVGQTLQEGLDQGAVKLQKFPASTVPEDAIKVIDATNGDLVALAALGDGQLLLASNFGDSNNIGRGLQVPEGKVALTLNLEDAAHVGSFLTPGAEVVLYDTYQVPSGATVVEHTGILLNKVLVLAVGNSVTTAAEDNKSAALVTIAVTPAESVRVVQAAQTSKVYFAILGANVDASNVQNVSPSNLFNK